jgi:hypothetical protein
MSRVFLCSPTNSQMFTTCCETAICSNQQKCPSCKQYVYPFDDGMTDKERDAISNHKTETMRWSMAFKK